MKFLIAGLGNMDIDYFNTRHNIGFEVADELARRNSVEWQIGRYAHITEFKFKGRLIKLIKPTTYMNLSGKAVKHWVISEQIPLENILIISDDLNIEFGRIRLKEQGSDGGHNGLKDITAQLGTQKYSRLRIGIGNNFNRGNQVNYVLGKWLASEEELLPQILSKSADACLSFCYAGIQNTMNQYNSFKIE